MIHYDGHIYCSECGDIGPWGRNQKQAERAAERRGWFVGSCEALCQGCRRRYLEPAPHKYYCGIDLIGIGEFERDICPECRAEIEREEWSEEEWEWEEEWSEEEWEWEEEWSEEEWEEEEGQ